jgi:hypothetical protein
LKELGVDTFQALEDLLTIVQSGRQSMKVKDWIFDEDRITPPCCLGRVLRLDMAVD